jgi:hypothetical protein
VKVLTVRQPWAGLLVAGIKDVENRGWRTSYRGPLLIHAGTGTDPYDAATPLLPNCALHGAILGMVTLLDCVRGYPSVWATPG